MQDSGSFYAEREGSSVLGESKNMPLRLTGDSKLSLNLNKRCEHRVMELNNHLVLHLGAVLNARSNSFLSLKTPRRVLQSTVNSQYLKLWLKVTFLPQMCPCTSDLSGAICVSISSYQKASPNTSPVNPGSIIISFYSNIISSLNVTLPLTP